MADFASNSSSAAAIPAADNVSSSTVASEAAGSSTAAPANEVRQSQPEDGGRINLHHRRLTLEQADRALNAEPERVNEIYRIGPNSKLDYDISPGTPLIAAVKYGNLPVAQTLVARGANINQAYEAGVTPLILACLYYKIELALFLINSGADLNIRDNVSRPVFHEIVYIRFNRRD